MAEEEGKSAEQELSDAGWVWATRVAIAAALIGAGYFGAYMRYGAADELAKENARQKDRIVKLENDRETESTKLAKVTRDKEVCTRELRALKAAQP